MINKQWMRAGVGVCGVASLVLGAGLMLSPAANAAPAADPTMRSSDVLGGTVSTVGGVVSGVLTPAPTASSPVTVGTGSGGVTVGAGSTTVSVGTGNGTVNVGVTGTGGSSVGVVLGNSTSSTTVAGTVTNPTTPATPTDTSTTTPTDSSSTAPASTPVMLTALSATPQYTTVYPAKDGYRDTVAFQLRGTTSDGQQHAASGTATLTFGSSVVTTWAITATDNLITWSGLKDGKIVPGRYTFTARIGDSTGAAVTGSATVDVSAKKLASTTQTLSAKSVSGKHRMAAKPLAGLSKGKVTLRIISTVSGIHGKQYLVFRHGAKKVKVLIRNGSHTSKSVTIPKSFTTYTISHTWKNHSVKIASLKYKYTFKALK